MDCPDFLSALTPTTQKASIVGLLLWEAFLGRTSIVKPNSTLGLVAWPLVSMIKKVYGYFKPTPKEGPMLEGNEAEGKIGDIGKYVVDARPDGIVRADLSAGNGGSVKAGAFVEIDMLEEFEKLAKRSDSPVDDILVGLIKKALGR